MVDAYEVLGVDPRADAAQLRAAHRRLVRRHHPDLAPPSQRPQATERVKTINVAYGLVRDPDARAAYDAARAGDDTTALDALTVAAGRWAGRWWRRNGDTIRDAARRTGEGAGRVAERGRRAGHNLAARVVWLLACALGTAVGWVLATAVTRLTVGQGLCGVLGGTLGGLAFGGRRAGDWHRRRLGAAVPCWVGPVGAVAWIAAVAGGLWLDVALR